MFVDVFGCCWIDSPFFYEKKNGLETGKLVLDLSQPPSENQWSFVLYLEDGPPLRIRG